MEKTFNDLLKPHQKRFDYHNSQRIYIDKADVLQLLQKVREATKAECMKIYEDDWGKYTGYKLMEALPTDRIKTDK